MFASIKQTFRLFVHKAGMKLVAAAGKITVQAHDDDIQIIANKVLTLISQTDWIDLKGKKGVRLHGSDCMIEVSDLVQVFSSKPVQFHGNLETLGPQDRPHPSTEHKITIAEPKAPDSKQLVFTLHGKRDNGLPFANVAYTLYKNGSPVEEGITDDLGRIAIEHKSGTPEYAIELANGEMFELKAWTQFDTKNKTQHSEQTLANRGARSLDGSTESRSHS
jgi:type VI secretion system secreted protein VgrG